MKTHQKRLNYNMLGLRVKRLALCSVHCSKFNKIQSTQPEQPACRLAAPDHNLDRFGYLSTSGNSQ